MPFCHENIYLEKKGHQNDPYHICINSMTKTNLKHGLDCEQAADKYVT